MSLMRPISSFRSDFDRLFSDFEREFFAPVTSSPTKDREDLMGMWSPPVNIKETEKDIVVTASVPGLKPEDMTVEVEGKTLTISGQTKDETEEKKDNYYRHEIVQGKFYRQVQLPVNVKEEEAKARFEHGLLEVSIPKSEQILRHKINISG